MTTIQIVLAVAFTLTVPLTFDIIRQSSLNTTTKCRECNCFRRLTKLRSLLNCAHLMQLGTPKTSFV